MRHEVFAVYDKKVKMYKAPNLFRDKEIAVRAFKNFMKTDKSELSEYPEDFEIYGIGIYDDDKGVFENKEPKEFVCRVDDITRKNKRSEEVFTVSEEMENKIKSEEAVVGQ